MKLYLAGPLFTYGEQQQNALLAAQLRHTFGYDCFLPQETEANLKGAAASAKDIFLSDVAGVANSDAIVACMDGPDPDSGTSWELGYAYALCKPAVLYRTDFRTACGDFDGQPVNLMLSVPAKAFVNFRCMGGDAGAIRKLAALIHDQLRRLAP